MHLDIRGSRVELNLDLVAAALAQVLQACPQLAAAAQTSLQPAGAQAFILIPCHVWDGAVRAHLSKPGLPQGLLSSTA